MAFDKDTGAAAGKKSKRGSSKQINEIREVYSELLHICLFSRPTSWKYQKSKWKRKWGSLQDYSMIRVMLNGASIKTLAFSKLGLFYLVLSLK
jgi:hypothetical protein